MKKISLSGIFFILFIFLIVVFIFYYPKQKLTAVKQLKSNTTIATQNPILTPSANAAVFGTKTHALLQTYTSPDGTYSITYPSVWTPGIQDQLKSFTGDTMVFTTGPVGKRLLGYPSFIQIAVDNNPQDETLSAFISHHFGTIHVSPITVNITHGLETTDLQGQVANTTIWIQPTVKIYQIRFFDGAAPKISQDAFNKVLASFTGQ